MKKKTKHFKNLLKIFILSILLILFLSETKKTSIDFITEQLQTIFKGTVSIKKIGLNLNGLFLEKIKITDSTKEKTTIFVSIDQITIPLTFLIKNFEPYLFIYNFHINLDNIPAKGWNILNNFKKQNDKNKTKISLPLINLKLINASANVDLYLDNELFSFILKKTNASGEIKGSKLAYDASGIEKNFGLSLSRGLIDFSNMKLILIHHFPEIELQRKFINRFLKNLFSFFADFTFSGKLNLKIPTTLENNHWLSPKYELKFDHANFIPQHFNWKLQNISGKLDSYKNELSAIGGSGEVKINKLTIPFENFSAKGFRKPGCIFFDPISANVFNGTLKANYTFMYNEKYFASLLFNHLNLQQIILNTAKNVEKDWQGDLSLNMQLTAAKTEDWKLNAAGKAQINNSNLYELPLFVGIFNFLNFNLPKKEIINSALTDWYTAEGKIFFQNIKISSKTTSFYGEGNINNDNNLDFHFAIRLNKTTLSSLTPIIGELTRKTYNRIMKELIAIKITRTLTNPIFQKTTIEQLPAKMIDLVFNILNPFELIESLLEKD